MEAESADMSKLVEIVSKVNLFFNTTAQPCQQKLITNTSVHSDMVELIAYPIISTLPTGRNRVFSQPKQQDLVVLI